MAVELDVNGSRFRHLEDGTKEYHRRCRAHGLAGANALALIDAALEDAQMPQPGDVLDATLFPTMRVVERNVERVDCQVSVKWAFVVVIYRTKSSTVQSEPDDNAPGVITVGAVVETVEEAMDRATTPAQITVEHDGVTQGGTVQVRRARPVLRFSRREETSPDGRAEAHVGNVNSTTFAGHGAGEVFCQSIIGRSDDGGESYLTDYEFDVNPDGHNPTVFFRGEDGLPPDGLVSGTGIKTVTSYDESNFNALNLT